MPQSFDEAYFLYPRVDAEKPPQLIEGKPIEIYAETTRDVVVSHCLALQASVDALREQGALRAYLPNALRPASSVRKTALQHTNRNCIIPQHAARLDLQALIGRGGAIDGILAVKGCGANYQNTFFTDPSGPRTTGTISPEGIIEPRRHEGMSAKQLRSLLRNTTVSIRDDQAIGVILKTFFSYDRPFGGQTKDRALRSFHCSESLAGSGIKYTPVIAVAPLDEKIENEIVALTQLAGMPVPQDPIALAQELILYPRSTRRGLALVRGGMTETGDFFENDDAREKFMEVMAEDCCWLLNWPGKSSRALGGNHGRVAWLRFTDFHLNREKLDDDLDLARLERKIFGDAVERVLYQRFNAAQAAPALRNQFFRYANYPGWVPFVLKDLLIHPREGTFITDFESAKIEETATHDHELWMYGVLYDYLQLALALWDTSVEKKLLSHALVPRDDRDAQKEFFSQVKSIYLKLFARLAAQRGGGLTITLGDEGNSINAELHYEDPNIPPLKTSFHILDFIKIRGHHSA